MPLMPIMKDDLPLMIGDPLVPAMADEGNECLCCGEPNPYKACCQHLEGRRLYIQVSGANASTTDQVGQEYNGCPSGFCDTFNDTFISDPIDEFNGDPCSQEWCFSEAYEDSCSGDPNDHVDLTVHMGFSLQKLISPDRWEFSASLRIQAPTFGSGACPGCGLGVSVGEILEETPPDCPTLYMSGESTISAKRYSDDSQCTEFPTPTMLGINHWIPCNLHKVGGTPTQQNVNITAWIE